MYSLEFLTAPVSAENPCGPDLDLQGDADFLQFTANADAVLPASYFRFDRLPAELGKQIAGMKSLLADTRDLRLLVILAKYQILDKQFDAFVTTISAIEHLITQHWQDVHPRGEDGDFAFRVNTLEALDDMAQVIMPMQHQALFKSKRAGPVSFRTSLLATGKLQPRDEESVLDSVNFEGAIADADVQEMIRSRDLMTTLKNALNAIQVNSRELLDFQGAVKFERFFPLVSEIAAFLDQSVAKRDPAAAILAGAEKGADGTPAAAGGMVQSTIPVLSGPIANLEQAGAALAAIGRYFALSEPSSPALLLIRQAQGLVGKSFFESIRALMPAHASDAMLLLGANPGFNMSVERLGEVAGEFYETPPEEASSTSSSDDGWGWDDTPSEESGEIAAEGDESATAETLAPEPQAAPSGTPAFVAHSRQDAFALMVAVQQFYMQSEPTSPVPLLIDRARSVGSLDFLSLMRLVMPNHAFKGADE